MTDHQYLDLILRAGKAAGYDLTHVANTNIVYINTEMGRKVWNPISSNGDAFLLIVTLHLMRYPALVGGAQWREDYIRSGNDRAFTTRLSAVRIAASLVETK